MIGSARLLYAGCAITLFVTAGSCASHKPAHPPPAPAPAPAPSPGSVALARLNPGIVPEELMTVLGRGAIARPGDATELRAGPAPDDFPKDVLPPGAEVGAVSVSTSITTVVGIASDVAATDRRKEQSRLTASGWISEGPLTRGFVIGAFEGMISVCRGTDFISLRYVPRPAGGSFVRAALTRDPRRGCVSRPDMGFPDVDIPVLTAPPGLRTYGGSSGGGGDSIYSQTRLDTTQKPQEIAAYYLSQMEAEGWKVDGRANEGDVVSVTRLGITSRIGDLITAVLTITAPKGSTSLDLVLIIVRNTPARGRIGGG